MQNIQSQWTVTEVNFPKESYANADTTADTVSLTYLFFIYWLNYKHVNYAKFLSQ